MSEAEIDFLEIETGAGRRRIEYVWHGPGPDEAPTLVFLHEGLGSIAMWKDFPLRLSQATGCGALVYSRIGYGASDPCDLPRPLTYMHEEGLKILPRLLDALKVGEAVLVGHSDGGSISLIHAGGGKPWPGLRGLILEAPHVFNEEVSVRSIEAAREAYESGDLHGLLARYHGNNTDCAFWGWNRAWLDPGFRDWNIEEYLPAISAPVLLIQGEDDQYGTLAQVEAIARQSGGETQTLILPDCGHSPHRDQAARALDAMAAFVAGLFP